MVLAHDLNENRKTKDIKTSQDVTFETMFFSSNTLQGLKYSGFVRPSPVQLHGIPLGKCGFDLLLEAKSGTGKTAVFTVVALEKLDLDKGLQAVILAPTREIAAQICDVFRQIGCQYEGLHVEVVMGGLPFEEDIEKLKDNRVHILVGSPGRLKHLIHEGHMDVSAVRLVVLDEADKLMEKSFLPDIKYIYSALPQDKQVILSSATYPESCKEFIKEFVQDAQHVCPNSDCVLLGVDQKVTYVKYHINSVAQTINKFKELLKIITTKQFKQCLIFCNYRARVAEVYKMLIKAKWPAEQLYGAQDQGERLVALKTLQEYKCRILITTDLAARGIDASNVDLVINFEPPFEWQTYLHRIGRAGRFGSYGMAITILSAGEEQKKFMNMLSMVNLSINLTPLWIEAENCNGSIEKETVFKAQGNLQCNSLDDSSSSDIWKIICGTDNPKENGIENFHELLNSFQNCNNIESFSDLIHSFQDNDLLDTKVCQYKCIDWPNLSTKQHLIGIKNIVQDTKSSVNENDYVNESEENACTKSNIQTTSNKRVANNSHTKNTYTKQICDENSFLNHNTHSMNIDNNFEKMRSVKTNDNINGFKHKNVYSEHNLTNNRKPTLFSSSSTSNGDFKTQTKASYSQSNGAEFSYNGKLTSSTSSTSANDHSDIANGISNSIFKTQSKVKNYKFNQYCSPHSHKVSSTFEAHSNDHSSKEYDSYSGYDEWFKKLKIKVKQIELAVYIDELSKL